MLKWKVLFCINDLVHISSSRAKVLTTGIILCLSPAPGHGMKLNVGGPYQVIFL